MLINKSKKILTISASLLIIMLVTVTGFFLYNTLILNNKDANINSEAFLISDGPCSDRDIDSILVESVSLFLRSAYTDNENENIERSIKQFDLEQKIIIQENFDKDANCLHILAMIYIDRGDLLAAEKHLELLSQGINASNPESYILDENANFLSIEEMELAIDNIRTAQQQAAENDPFKDQNRLDERIDE
jgi:hypothetical protein